MIRQAPPGSGGESGPRAKTRRGKPNDPPGPGRLVGRAVSRQPPVRERTEQDRDGRPARTFRDDGRRAGGDGSGRAHAGGYRREKGRNDASAAEAASGRHFAGRGEGRPAAGARPERRPSKPRVPQQERWQLVSPLLPEPDAALREGLDLLGAALARIRPLAAAHARSLPQDVAALSRLLTVERAHLHQPYWASPALISAYLYYFLPWNVLRQARLLSALPLPDPRIWLEQGRRPLLLDMGSGPLSLPIALWLARPEWRALPLSVLALDASSQPLELGAGAAARAGRDTGAVRMGDPHGTGPAGAGGATACPYGRTAPPAPLRRGEAPALWLASAANVLNEMLSGGGAGRTGRRDGVSAWEADDDTATPGDLREDSLFGQRLESVLDSLEEVLEGGAPSLPASLLVVEPGTRLGGTAIMRFARGGAGARSRAAGPLHPCGGLPAGAGPQRPWLVSHDL